MNYERMAKKIYYGKLSKKKGHLKSMRTPRRACMKGLMTVDEAKEVCRDDRSVWRSVRSDYPARDKA